MKMRRTISPGGRKPKPTALRLIEGGNLSRKDDPNEPKPKLGCEPANYLPELAKQVWDKFYPKLNELKLITETDEHLFANYCILAAKMIADPNGFKVAESVQLRLLGSSFGMCPSARAVININTGKSEDKEEVTSMR